MALFVQILLKFNGDFAYIPLKIFIVSYILR